MRMLTSAKGILKNQYSIICSDDIHQTISPDKLDAVTASTFMAIREERRTYNFQWVFIHVI